MTTKPKRRSGALTDFGTHVLAWIMGAVLLLTGCGSGAQAGAEEQGERPTRASQPHFQYDDEDYEPTDQEIEEAVQSSWEKAFGQVWSCFYDPTMNNDWHDDVRCTDGANSHRPILLADWGFVTEEDMRAAGQEYESYLNAGGTP